MVTLRLSEQQFQSLQNILAPQPVLFGEIDRVMSLTTLLKSPRINPNNTVEIDINSEDLELLHGFLQEGVVRIKEIPAALELLRALTPSSQEDGPLYDEDQDVSLSASVHHLGDRKRD